MVAPTDDATSDGGTVSVSVVGESLRSLEPLEGDDHIDRSVPGLEAVNEGLDPSLTERVKLLSAHAEHLIQIFHVF
jgi:hypothetical protein